MGMWKSVLRHSLFAGAPRTAGIILESRIYLAGSPFRPAKDYGVPLDLRACTAPYTPLYVEVSLFQLKSRRNPEVQERDFESSPDGSPVFVNATEHRMVSVVSNNRKNAAS